MPVLSVVVAAHGVAAYLPACLDSLLDGPSDDLEVVAVDDFSPDECGAIIDGYAGRDARLRALHLEPNRGLGPARNAGLAAATGEYVWFVDGDDVIAGGAVAAVLDRLKETRPSVLLLRHAWLVGERVRPDPHATRLPRVGGASVRDRPALLRARQAAWNRVVRRNLLDHGLDLFFPSGWYEDVTFSHLSLVAADRIATLGRLAYLYRQRDGAITATVSPRHFEVFRQYERLFEALPTFAAGVAARPYLFELMIEHYLVVVGTEARVPPSQRAEFFARIVEHYHRYLPPEGYQPPTGLAGLKQRFVRWDAYSLFHIFRTTYRTARRARRAVRAWVRAIHAAKSDGANPEINARIGSRPTR